MKKTLIAVGVCSLFALPGIAQATPSGALVKVKTTSEVGVLLDEVPAAMRERVAAEVLAKAPSFWLARAKRQIDLARYRLVYRHFFYAPEDGKRQLPLPPESVWDVTLTGAAQRKVVDGHDVVTIPYRFKTFIVTDAASVALADPALAQIRGYTEEAFTLPIDPDLIFQRTGYACADEADFPPNSVDSENVSLFFDDSCVPETLDTLLCRRAETVDLVTESCVDALTAHVGTAAMTLRFKRVPFREHKAAQYRVGQVTTQGTPDLAVRQQDLGNNRITYRYIDESSCAVAESCVGGTGWRKLLQFDAGVHNQGTAPLHLGSVDYYLAGETSLNEQHHVFEYSACHEHLHFEHYGTFLYGGDPSLGSKRAFCLLSTERYSNNEQTPLVTDYSNCEYQGIEAGWGDIYKAGLECQWLDITDVDVSAGPTTDSLTFQANDDGFLCEGTRVLDANGDPLWEATSFTTAEGEPVDRMQCSENACWSANNQGSLPVTIPESGGLVTGPCANVDASPAKNCGFAAGANAACVPGATVTLQCTTPDPTKAQIVRVCEVSDALGSIACTHADAIANSTIGAPTTFSFPCPAVRDASSTAPYGAYSLYGGALWDADGVAPVSCAEL
jgi:hypothetical protein